MPMINVELKKNEHENATNLIRRFTRKIQESGIILKVKGKRYNERPMSKLSEKTVAIRRIARRAEVEKLKKLGKMETRKPRR
ncbi:30S ribosomal protein S21 [Candidatus Nomurabacteria bacterium]|nr:30S ribosomal protein S21 [Candidatus Nomurabacteria bacterium]